MAFTPNADTLRLASAGVAAAQDDLIREIAPRITRQLLRYPLDREERRDLLQATLTRAVCGLCSFRGDSAFSTWLFRVTANEALMLMRSKRSYSAHFVAGVDFEELEALPPAAQEEFVDAVVDRETRDARVRAVVERLPDRFRDVLVAHYREGLELVEIAERLHMTESAVRSRLHRARRRLKRLLGATPELGAMAFAA
jgi:RNA polymerase sigma-70 factor, ECF subfamily